MPNQRPIILLVVLIVVVVLAVGVLWWIKSQDENGSVNTNAALAIDLTSFKAMAQQANCADKRNDLYVIDNHMVFWAKEGACFDASYSYVLYGKTPQERFCQSADSVVGQMKNCDNQSYQEIFNTILNNKDEKDLGLGILRTIQRISLVESVNTNANTNTSVPSSKSCDQDSDCGLLICGGCYSNEYLKTAPADLPCTTYDGYICQCVKNRCIEVKPDKPYDFLSVKNEADCLALGAEWVSVGKMMRCEIPTPDVGKTCTKASDCIRYCGQKNVNDATGTCSAHSGTSCYRFFNENGKLDGVCID